MSHSSSSGYICRLASICFFISTSQTCRPWLALFCSMFLFSMSHHCQQLLLLCFLYTTIILDNVRMVFLQDAYCEYLRTINFISHALLEEAGSQGKISARMKIKHQCWDALWLKLVVVFPSGCLLNCTDWLVSVYLCPGPKYNCLRRFIKLNLKWKKGRLLLRAFLPPAAVRTVASADIHCSDLHSYLKYVATVAHQISKLVAEDRRQ